MSHVTITRILMIGTLTAAVVIAPIATATAALAADATFPPVANVDNYTTPQDVPLSIDAAGGLLANDLDGGNAGLVVDAVTLSSGGSLGQNPDGSFLFTPDAGFVGTAHFIYNDVATGFYSNSTDVWIEVTAVATKLVGAPDFYTTPMNTTLHMSGNGRPIDNDPDGTYVGGNDDVTGEIDMNVYGEFDYTPAPDFVGIKTFSYWLDDKQGHTSDPILITIEVTGPAAPETPGDPTPGDPTTLAMTGTPSDGLLAPGLALLIAGLGAVWFARRQEPSL